MQVLQKGLSMDVLSDVLSAVHLRGSLYFFTEFAAPWGVRVPRFGHVARFHLVLRGNCWVRIEGEAEPTLLGPGDLVLVPHGAEHTLTDAPETPCLTVDRVLELTGFAGRGALVYGGEDRGNPTRMVCGHFEFDEAGEHPFLSRLPTAIAIRQHESVGSGRLEDLIRFIAGEVRDGKPGSDAVVHRLSEVMFFQAVRIWAERNAHEPGLMAALDDPNLGRSLAAIHERPGHGWTLDALSREARLSRTVFAERFHRVVGLTPIQYLAFWRVQTARGLLTQQNLSLEGVAERLGYESPAAFSRVFKKWAGASPGAYRRARAAA